MESLFEAAGGEAGVLRIHCRNGEHTEMDERAIACFDSALADVGITGPLGEVLHAWFTWATTVDMVRHPDSADDVPDGGAVPRWTWDGLRP